LKHCKTVRIMRRLFRPGMFDFFGPDKAENRLGFLEFVSNATRCRILGPRSGIFVVCRPCGRDSRSNGLGMSSSNALADAARQSAKILAWQLVWIAASAVACAAIFDLRSAWSVLAGGGIGLVWTAYMAVTLYRHSLSHGMRLGAASFLLAWLIKLALTISLLLIALRSPALTPLGVLGGLFGAMVAYWAWLALRRQGT
jgi:F0F1-type ATP synthase assembly protein I